MAWFRRGKGAKSSQDDAQQDAPTAESTAPGAGADSGAGATPADTTDASGDGTLESRPAPEHSPRDARDVTSDEGYLRLGAIWVPAVEGMMLTFEMDQSQSLVTAVQVVRGDSALQLQAFAAPRSAGIWDEIRDEIAEGLRAQGSSATEETGEFGTELVVETGSGVMRFVGVDGPRWFLRGVLSGRAAVDPAAAAPLRELFTHLVVDRGDEPMGPRELLPLTLPNDDSASEADGDPGRSASDLDPFTRGPEITEIR